MTTITSPSEQEVTIIGGVGEMGIGARVIDEGREIVNGVEDNHSDTSCHTTREPDGTSWQGLRVGMVCLQEQSGKRVVVDVLELSD